MPVEILLKLKDIIVELERGIIAYEHTSHLTNIKNNLYRFATVSSHMSLITLILDL
jgi:hypothetical protein